MGEVASYIKNAFNFCFVAYVEENELLTEKIENIIKEENKKEKRKKKKLASPIKKGIIEKIQTDEHNNNTNTININFKIDEYINKKIDDK